MKPPPADISVVDGPNTDMTVFVACLPLAGEALTPIAPLLAQVVGDDCGEP
jgi:hypothetical protein